ncbi:hypothetical protein AJ78_03102 [Emergomyces pasteurianus Ep9510]|uniref:N-acetylgalactosaminide beta-1,3-galactosyltransferase n=1 Tax=Emergomyces pasteurianus Ep9510 TaxID=1447872 RepID=A0A1J9QLJ9_9EURO|nr:hypothetical protein AJ78_03102 [Emergomyces pasteurianus Ep9510]
MKPLHRVYRPSRRRIYLFCFVVNVFLGSYLLWRTFGGICHQWTHITPLNLLSLPHPEETICPSFPGVQDIHFILKTGASESLRKLPIHFNTTLRCIPHFSIFSDYEEDVSGFHVYDVLRDVDERFKNEYPEFKLYNSLRDSGREALSAWHDVKDQESTPGGKPDNPAWVLDKWKFLPMMRETLRARANAKWYIFVEADTYILWPNLFAWLDKFNASEPHYIGHAMAAGDITFGHGGSGYILSHPALKTITESYSADLKKWGEFTGNHWAGDCVLGKLIKEAGMDLLWSWPMLQDTKPWTFDYFENQHDPWCYPPVSYHHMDPEDIQAIWDFEMNWRRENASKHILHRDVFIKLIQPGCNKLKQDWDNRSNDVISEVPSAAECAARCAANEECVQYSYESETCRTSKVPKLGVRKAGSVSGWMAERINQTVTQKSSCEKIEWINPRN